MEMFTEFAESQKSKEENKETAGLLEKLIVEEKKSEDKAEEEVPPSKEKESKNEDAILDLKSKLYRFDKDGNQWKERGAGNVKLLEHKQTGKVRPFMIFVLFAGINSDLLEFDDGGDLSSGVFIFVLWCLLLCDRPQCWPLI
ncbi:hypothetical protein Patl1_33845 [Pistacia atlantica]|uniref:Uncharacterized protein n=1 Tax=Pistacia atlantica TaxID=434234 RepID=A0ACC0ZXF7_9ROSI|nr:hypothetical protein Patl1_33845 [Pistacia atlantica]